MIFIFQSWDPRLTNILRPESSFGRYFARQSQNDQEYIPPLAAAELAFCSRVSDKVITVLFVLAEKYLPAADVILSHLESNRRKVTRRSARPS